MIGRRQAEEERAERSAARAAQLARMPEGVRPLVQSGFEERDAHFERFAARRWKLWRRCLLDGAVLFAAVELLVSWVAPPELLAGALVSAALVGLLVGASWIPLVGRGWMGLQLVAPLTAMPAYLALRFVFGAPSTILDLRHLLASFVLGLLAAWIGFCRDEEQYGA